MCSKIWSASVRDYASQAECGECCIRRESQEVARPGAYDRQPLLSSRHDRHPVAEFSRSSGLIVVVEQCPEAKAMSSMLC